MRNQVLARLAKQRFKQHQAFEAADPLLSPHLQRLRQAAACGQLERRCWGGLARFQALGFAEARE
nr:hypothetical protein [Betaproteobacteria bacterium]